ncbi:serine hydrolase [Actinoplanes couchii]|uniref:Serine hydrolase n=1 Tax=Actinoplanes couchii TaxID=403638 RepID=A0ABQ3XP35_9ACTN|nr:serine hydrolase [Actinoplanes couchii]MDR6318660.1 beta-lactamase class A [Actinoplanes couchii]GID60267.1 serine hydrolase [Actinoplanes couchii]
MNATAVVRTAHDALQAAGLRGSFLVRDVDTGDEIEIDADIELPVASLVKIPLAVVTLERVARGELDAATRIEVAPGRIRTPGPTGLSRFRHPAVVAIDDLLYLAVAISDNAAADALFDLTPPAAVDVAVRGLGLAGIAVRHRLGDLTDTPVERFGGAEPHLAQALAIGGGTSGGGHAVAQLDPSRANTGTARAYADLLTALWRPSAITPQTAARLRELLAANVIRHRLAPDFSSDAAQWSSKTGTLLNLRHEAGVVEHADGRTFAVVAMTESQTPAAVQTAAEALMGRVARDLRDTLRGRR